VAGASGFELTTAKHQRYTAVHAISLAPVIHLTKISFDACEYPSASTL